MYSILHDFTIHASRTEVFKAFTDPDQFNKWWTLKCEGIPGKGEEYRFYFSDEYDWKAVVDHFEKNQSVNYKMIKCSPEWEGTTFGIDLEEDGESTLVHFFHLGWSQQEAEYRRTSFCWANLLYLLKRWVEDQETLDFEKRDRSS